MMRLARLVRCTVLVTLPGLLQMQCFVKKLSKNLDFSNADRYVLRSPSTRSNSPC